MGLMLPPYVKGLLRYARGHHSDFYPWGGPMNASTARLEAARQIFYKCAILSIIETGTFRGTTTEWFAQLGVPVMSIESHAPTFEFASRRLKRFANVSVLPGSSTAVLPDCLRSVDRSSPTMIYLDAHWEGHLPLAEELEVICRSLDRFVIIVDDFEVPGDTGYSFDNYGPGNAEYLNRSAGQDLERFYPSVPSNEETGTRRGWIVLTKDSEFIKTLSTVSLLRRS